MEQNISQAVIRRMPRYYRYLGELLDAGVERISSGELSKMMHVTASQIRQDLNNFGGFGQQGYGYNVQFLYDEIGKILGVGSNLKTILIGAGNLGRALALQIEFEKRGFNLIGIFDKNEALSGQVLRGLPIRPASDIEDFCKENGVEVAILCIPYAEAAANVPMYIDCGIKGFWNFSHYNINEKYPRAVVENMHFNDSLMALCYQVINAE
jgi:redox-sensing transcriptional repressor